VSLATILVTAGVGLVASVVTAYVTAHLTARQAMQRWHTELAAKYAELVADYPTKAQALARQFAIGVLIFENGNPEDREKYFIAPHTRMTAGRAPDNEIVLPGLWPARRHFAISADDKNVYVEDLGSANGTNVSRNSADGARNISLPVHGPCILKPGDAIQICSEYHLEFQSISSRR
jgi:pSer/pThr/pTyr-binding forkhead associated (FHA) protein